MRLTRTAYRQAWLAERKADLKLCKIPREIEYMPIGKLMADPGPVESGQIREVPIEVSRYTGGFIQILVLAQWDTSWLCLPLSPYGIPASHQEYVIRGSMVGQTWNARNLSDITLRRMGAPVDELSETHVQVARAMFKQFLTGDKPTKVQAGKQGYKIENHEKEYGAEWLAYSCEWASYISQMQVDMW